MRDDSKVGENVNSQENRMASAIRRKVRKFDLTKFEKDLIRYRVRE